MKKWHISLIAIPLLLAGCQATGALGGTSWTVLEVLGSDDPDIVDMDLTFGTNGVVTSQTTYEDGRTEMRSETYSVHDALISVQARDGELHVLHRIEGEEMILTSERFQARLLRLD